MQKSDDMLREVGIRNTFNVFISKTINFALMICIVFFAFSSNAYATKIIELTIKGTIGPATADYIERSIDKSQNADLIIILLDTPGGLNEATRIIIQKFLSSQVPIVTYVAPYGARAASAGTYLVYASTLAAMAPGTQLGAATPVSLGAGFINENNNEKNTTIMDKKITNDAIATIRSLAQLRERNLNFAEKAIINAETMTDLEALNAGVINYIAKDDRDLIAQLNGVTVIQNNQKITLHTIGSEIERVDPDWRNRFLSVISSPTVAYLLMLLGIYGIFFELVNPGFVLPGVVGTISMLIALYALQLLPVNYASLGLIILGMVFIIAEAFTPSFGVLGLGGTASFILGSIMLMNTDSAAYQIAWSVIWAMAAVNVLIFVVLLGMVLRSRNNTIKNGLVMLVGAKGRALGDINLEGQAVIRGEIWRVHAKYPIAADKQIKVIMTTGLLLEVQEDYSVD